MAAKCTEELERRKGKKSDEREQTEKKSTGADAEEKCSAGLRYVSAKTKTEFMFYVRENEN